MWEKGKGGMIWENSSPPHIVLCFLMLFFIVPSTFHLGKAMAPHSSTLAWKIPWVEEPGRLQSMGSLGVRHYLMTSLSLFIFMRWRRKWQLTPVFLPGESQGQGSLVGCRLWGHTESDTTEVTEQQQQQADSFTSEPAGKPIRALFVPLQSCLQSHCRWWLQPWN